MEGKLRAKELRVRSQQERSEAVGPSSSRENLRLAEGCLLSPPLLHPLLFPLLFPAPLPAPLPAGIGLTGGEHQDWWTPTQPLGPEA